jgi:hypothetical protein
MHAADRSRSKAQADFWNPALLYGSGAELHAATCNRSKSDCDPPAPSARQPHGRRSLETRRSAVFRIIQLLFGALLLLLLLLLGAGLTVPAPAVAAGPTQPFRYEECLTSDLAEYCFGASGVLVQQNSPAGNSVYKFSEKSFYRLTENGQVTAQASNIANAFYLWKGEETQVAQAVRKGQFSYGNTTCTYNLNYTVVDGEFRHRVSDFQCTP